MVTIVEADNINDYLARYYKHDRLKDVDSAYGPGTLLSFYQLEYECLGFVCTSGYDNVTGKFIAWPRYKESTQEEIDIWSARRDTLQTEVNKKNKIKDQSTTVLIGVPKFVRRESRKLGLDYDLFS